MQEAFPCTLLLTGWLELQQLPCIRNVIFHFLQVLLGRQVLKLLFIVCSVVKQTFQCCFAHVAARIQEVADGGFAKAHAGQSSCSLCSSIKALFSTSSGLLFVILTDPRGKENMKSIPLFDWLQRGLWFCSDHCLSPWIVCDGVKRGQVTNIQIIFLIKSHGGLV